MIEAVSCGGIVIYRGKILTLYKSYRNKYEGWVLPKGTVEPGETHEQTAVREVYEESGVHGTIIKYVGKSQYSFSIPEDTVEKEVHWYLMASSGYYSRPQREEYFVDSGYYKYHEAYHLLKFSNERQILEKAYQEYLELKKAAPKKVTGTVRFGFDDPALTGETLGILGMIYGKLPKDLSVQPDFEQEILRGDVRMKGSFQAVTAAGIALRLFRDQNLRKTIRHFKHKEA